MSQENFTPLHPSKSQAQGSLHEQWRELSSQIRQQWPELSYEDLLSIDGDSRKLIALVHQKTGAASLLS